MTPRDLSSGVITNRLVVMRELPAALDHVGNPTVDELMAQPLERLAVV